MPPFPRLLVLGRLALGLALGLAAMRAQAQAQNQALPAVPTPEEAAEIVPLLQKGYVDPAALRDLRTPEDLAALWPALAAGRGVFLLSAAEPPAKSAPPVRSELLPGRIGYWRAAGFNLPKNGAALASGLADWQASGTEGAIVDLRNAAAPDDYAGAARAASFFVPAETVLFTIQGLQVAQQVYTVPAGEPGPRPSSLPLVVLINGRTRGAAEVLADALRRDAGAILVGRSTAGESFLYLQKRLRSGRTVRWAQAPVLLPDGTPLGARPVSPDIAVYVDPRAEEEALAQIELGPAARGLVEAPLRHRMNEASLVHEENPEIDEALSEQAARQKKGEIPTAPPLQDVTLMRAADILKGIALWPGLPGSSPASPSPATP